MSTIICKAQKLRDIITLEKGKPPAQHPYFGLDAELYLTPEYLRGRGTAEPVKASANAVRVSDGDTIVLWDGSNAGEFFRGRKGILASTMSRIQHGETFDVEYLFYAVKSWESYLKGQTSGSGIPHVDKEVLSNLEVFQFAKPEQTKIAEILSTVDRVIEQTEALIAKQQRIKTGLMQDLLTRGIDEQGNLRSEQTHEFKDSPLGRIPVEWEVCQWKQIVTKWGYGPRFSAVNYSENGNVKTIRGSDFTKDGDILYSQVPLALLPPFFVARHKLEQNDVVVVTTADCGVTSVFEGQDCDYIASAYAVRYQFNERTSPHFVKYFMQMDVAKKQVNEYVRQGTLGNLPGSDLLKIWMPLLTLTEQVKYVETLDLSSQSICEQNDYLSKLRSLKTALMQDLLTGKKRVTALLNDTEVVSL